MAAERKVRSAFIIATVLLCIVGFISYFSILRLREDVAWVDHSHRVIISLESLYGAVTEVVAAQRGFAITGEGGYLEIHDRGMEEVHAELRNLRELTADNIGQQQRIDSLVSLVAEREAFSKRAIELRQKGQPGAAQLLIGSGKGNDIHGRIRRLVDETEDEEKALLKDRETRAERASVSARLIILMGGLLAILSAAASLVLIARDFAGRRKAEAALQDLVDQLEMRVEEGTRELGRAVTSLRSSEVRLGGIIQSAMDAIITIDEDQKIILFNDAAEKVFGCPAADAIGTSLDRFVPERFRHAHRGHVERFGETSITSRRMGERMTLAGLRADGREFPIDASISHVAIDGKRLFTVILRDVTERKKAESELHRAHHEWRTAVEQLTAIIQSAMDAVITIDQEQRIVLFNDAAEKIFLCKSSAALGQPLDHFIPERFRAAHRAHVERFGETRVTTRLMGSQLTLAGLRSNGEEFPIDASISQVTVEGKKLYTVILRDITERKSAEDALRRSYDELRDLSGAMHAVREAERTRVARELHDELAQWLTAIKMDVSWLSQRLPRGQTQLIDKTEKVKGLVDTTVNAVRRIAADLRPVMLDDLGLVPAIESLLHDVSQRTGILVSLDTGPGDLEFRDPLATALYRMTQEALTNVARHAGATEVRVTIARQAEDLVLQVRDNGRGFDPAVAARKKSYGVLGIQERARTLGGRANITRVEDGGTLVEIVMPIARYRERTQGA